MMSGNGTLVQWQKALRDSGVKLTVPRRVILEALGDFSEPLSSEDLLSSARSRDRLISLATVYRTLPLLESAGLIHRLESTEDAQRYRVGPPERSQVVLHCQDCGQALPLADECLELTQSVRARNLGFRLQQVSLRLRAHCVEFDETGNCPYREAGELGGSTP